MDRTGHHWHIGATSCVYSGSIVENVRRLALEVDDVELVLFDVEGYGCNFPTSAEVAELHALACEYDLTYTVHLPRDIISGNDSLTLAHRAIAATCALQPYAYVVHLDGRRIMGDPTAAVVHGWQCDAQTAVRELIAALGDPRKLCLENLEGWSPHYFDGIVEETGISRCIDIGHLWLEGREASAYLRQHLPQTRVVHLHGTGERDHASLAVADPTQLRIVLGMLHDAAYDGIVTLEVFTAEEWQTSREAVLRVI
jgi:sugar phosphate isomerase/epimerase